MFARHDAFLPADPFRPLDTLQLALWHFSQCDAEPENYKLGTLCAFFGIDASGAHDALVDVRLNVELARRVLEEERNA